MKFLTIQTKGGVGKSTIAQQILATFFLARKMPVTLSEIDDENLDSAYLTDSAIKSEQIKLGAASDASLVIEKLMERFDENTVIDVGGNRTATNFIKEAGSTGFFGLIDLVVVPISSPGQDEINALRTIELIRSAHPVAKIILAVTRQLANDEAEFDGVFQRYFDVDALMSAADEIIYLPQIMAMVHSRQLNMTMFEMAQNKDQLAAYLMTNIVEAQRAGRTQEAIKLTRIRKSVVESGDLLKFIESAHAKLEKLLAPAEQPVDVAAA